MMHVLNHNVPADFYQAFVELLENSSLRSRAGTIRSSRTGSAWTHTLLHASCPGQAEATWPRAHSGRPLHQGSQGARTASQRPSGARWHTPPRPRALVVALLCSIQSCPKEPSSVGSRWWKARRCEGRSSGSPLSRSTRRQGRVGAVHRLVPARRWRDRLLHAPGRDRGAKRPRARLISGSAADPGRPWRQSPEVLLDRWIAAAVPFTTIDATNHVASGLRATPS